MQAALNDSYVIGELLFGLGTLGMYATKDFVQLWSPSNSSGRALPSNVLVALCKQRELFVFSAR